MFVIIYKKVILEYVESGRKLNLLHQSLTLSYLLLILHNGIPDFHGHRWIPVYGITKGNGNLQVQYIPPQRTVTRQEHAIMWPAGMNCKPHPQQESFALAGREMLLFCRWRSRRGVRLGTPGTKHLPPAPASAVWVASTDTGLPQRLSSAKQWPLSTGITFDEFF